MKGLNKRVVSGNLGESPLGLGGSWELEEGGSRCVTTSVAKKNEVDLGRGVIRRARNLWCGHRKWAVGITVSSQMHT